MKRLGAPPFICLITEGKANPENYEQEGGVIVEIARTAAADGVNLIQIREKALDGRMLFDLTRRVLAAVAGSGARVLVNDRADVAAAAGADGVHLPERSLTPKVVGDNFSELVIGVSTHSIDAARSAASNGADYVFFGPIFDTPGKGEAVGCDALAGVCRAVAGFPVIALGGIDDRNYVDALAAGAAGLAAIRSLHDPESRRSICDRLKAGGDPLRYNTLV